MFRCRAIEPGLPLGNLRNHRLEIRIVGEIVLEARAGSRKIYMASRRGSNGTILLSRHVQ